LRIPSSKFSKDGESTILYELNAVVVHCGKEINRGHYITLVRAHPHHDQWLCFDDEEGKLQKNTLYENTLYFKSIVLRKNGKTNIFFKSDFVSK
jgi:uncharacterized UBP type Zn finger protein